MNRFLPVDQMKLSEVTVKEFHAKKDSSIRQIFYLKRLEDDKIGYYVGLANVKKSHLMSNVKGGNNIIFVQTKEAGERAFYGAGAGGRETASVMVDDLIYAVTMEEKKEKITKVNYAELIPISVEKML